jgi:hypothetical protein
MDLYVDRQAIDTYVELRCSRDHGRGAPVNPRRSASFLDFVVPFAPGTRKARDRSTQVAPPAFLGRLKIVSGDTFVLI